MTPPHIWESIIVHSAILFTPTGDTKRYHRRTRQTPEQYQRDFATALAARRAPGGRMSVMLRLLAEFGQKVTFAVAWALVDFPARRFDAVLADRPARTAGSKRSSASMVSRSRTQ